MLAFVTFLGQFLENGGNFSKSVKYVRNACAVLIVTALVVASCSQGGSVEGKAGIMAREFVKQQLVAPSTARFGEYTTRREGTENTYSVDGEVDSENVFGASLRKRYHCKLRYSGHGDWTEEANWTLLEISIE